MIQDNWHTCEDFHLESEVSHGSPSISEIKSIPMGKRIFTHTKRERERERERGGGGGGGGGGERERERERRGKGGGGGDQVYALITNTNTPVEVCQIVSVTS